MGRVRFYTSSDEHISDQAPVLRTDCYLDTVLKKIAWQHEFAQNSECTALIRGGDFFHHKAPSKTSHSTILRLYSILSSFQIPTYAAVGNHDVQYNNLEMLKNAPLGVMYQHSSFNRLNTKVFESSGVTVKLVAVDYDPNETLDSLLFKIKKDPDYSYTMAVVHGLAENKPREKVSKFFGDAIYAYEDLDMKGVADVLMFGHYHKDQGVIDGSHTKIINLGSMTRGSLTFENLSRKPKNSLVTFTHSGIDIDQIEVPCADASKVFDLEKKRIIERELKDISDFVEKIRSSNMSTDDTIKSFKETIKNDYPERLSRLALDFLEAAEAGTVE